MARVTNRDSSTASSYALLCSTLFQACLGHVTAKKQPTICTASLPWVHLPNMLWVSDGEVLEKLLFRLPFRAMHFTQGCARINLLHPQQSSSNKVLCYFNHTAVNPVNDSRSVPIRMLVSVGLGPQTSLTISNPRPDGLFRKQVGKLLLDSSSATERVGMC